MKGLMGFVCLLLIGICTGMGYLTMQTEMHADRWNERVTSLEHVEALNMDLVRAMEYSDLSMATTATLAGEISTMCQRDAKMVEVVAAFEEENRALKNSLSESVNRLEDQLEQINDLFDENDNLYWEIGVMQDTVVLMLNEKEALQRHIDTLERALDKFTALFPPTIVIPPLTNRDGTPLKGPE
jgi:regulator of replication initiation timing